KTAQLPAHVPRMVSAHGAVQTKLVLVADIGTGGCAIGFAFRNARGQGEPQNFLDLGKDTKTPKPPTAILLRRDPNDPTRITIVAFGTGAINRHIEEQARAAQAGRPYDPNLLFFAYWKMCLKGDTFPADGPMLTAANGVQMLAIEVFAYTIKWLFERA